MADEGVTPDDMLAIRQDIMEWLTEERVRYADLKYPPGEGQGRKRLEDMAANGVSDTSEEMIFLTNYLSRAQMFGVDTPQGRQAFGKFTVTAIAMMERMVAAFGPMPMPGVPSGTIKEWKDD